MNRTTSYALLLTAAAICATLAVVTLIPNAAASKPNVLGYRSVCSYAPASTALCALAAGLVCTLRARTVAPNASSARYRPLFLPVGLGVILLVVAVVFGVRFSVVQSRFQAIIRQTSAVGSTAAAGSAYADGTRSATASEGEISATVEVTVKSGKLEGLRLLAGQNVEQDLAARLFKEVGAAQSTAVDAVSGATASSRVLLSAIEGALRKAR